VGGTGTRDTTDTRGTTGNIAVINISAWKPQKSRTKTSAARGKEAATSYSAINLNHYCKVMYKVMTEKYCVM
jgi:hypothetical protein